MIHPLLTSRIDASFAMDFQVEGPCAYTMVALDTANFLLCALPLEIRKHKIGEKCPGPKARSGEVICHFPGIDDGQLRRLVGYDITLCGIIVTMFKMKILERFFIFGAEHHAKNLVIVADAPHAEDLAIYRDFLTYRGREVAAMEGQARLVIPVDQEPFDAWMDFTEIVTLMFEHILCRERERNPAIKRYLKLRGLTGA